MTTWEKPAFEELAMNAEIGAYQPDDWDGERQYERLPSAVSGGNARSTPAPIRALADTVAVND